MTNEKQYHGSYGIWKKVSRASPARTSTTNIAIHTTILCLVKCRNSKFRFGCIGGVGGGYGHGVLGDGGEGILGDGGEGEYTIGGGG